MIERIHQGFELIREGRALGRDTSRLEEKVKTLQMRRNKKVEQLRLSEFERRDLAVEIYSEVLGCTVWLCSNKEMASQVKRDDPEACYTTHELRELVKLNLHSEDLKKIHDAKRVFPGSSLKAAIPYEVPEIIRQDQNGEDAST